MQSETGIVAVPIAADAWTDVNEFVVPAGVKSLIRFIGSLAPDMGAAGAVRIAPVFRLQGSGLGEQSPHEFVGPCGNAVMGGTGAGTLQLNHEEYELDIPVTVGGTIMVQVNTLDEAVTAGTVRTQLVYSDASSKAKNSQAQYIDHAMAAAADVWAEVGTITVPVMATGKNPTRIKEVIAAFATDQAALALLRCSARFRLTGSGLAEGGAHEFLGPASGTIVFTEGVLTYDRQVVRHKTEIPVNPGGQILVEQLLDVETPTDGTAILGLLYE